MLLFVEVHSGGGRGVKDWILSGRVERLGGRALNQEGSTTGKTGTLRLFAKGELDP